MRWFRVHHRRSQHPPQQLWISENACRKLLGSACTHRMGRNGRSLRPESHQPSDQGPIRSSQRPGRRRDANEGSTAACTADDCSSPVRLARGGTETPSAGGGPTRVALDARLASYSGIADTGLPLRRDTNERVCHHDELSEDKAQKEQPDGYATILQSDDRQRTMRSQPRCAPYPSQYHTHVQYRCRCLHVNTGGPD